MDPEVVLVEILFWMAVLALYYVYDGYFRFLRLISFFRPVRQPMLEAEPKLPKITVLVTVFNEAASITEKVENILKCTYPSHLLQILIASDGSTDGTDDIVQRMEVPNVEVYRPPVRKGKTDTQNRAVPHCKGDIIIFSDADTRFDNMFLRNIVVPFSDPKVGGADGHLLFNIEKKSDVSLSQGKYWNYELRLREAESPLGLLAVASGACMAIRGHLFRPMEAEYGEDCIVPLDIVQQGYKMFHASTAIAYDFMEHDSIKELRTRVRMTIRTIQGTFGRKSLLNPFLHPGYAFALWSHKLLRWLSPIFLIFLTLSSIWLAGTSIFFWTIFMGLIGFYLAACVGFFLEWLGWKSSLFGTAYSFLLANFGFLVGLSGAALGCKIAAYRNES